MLPFLGPHLIFFLLPTPYYYYLQLYILPSACSIFSCRGNSVIKNSEKQTRHRHTHTLANITGQWAIHCWCCVWYVSWFFTISFIHSFIHFSFLLIHSCLLTSFIKRITLFPSPMLSSPSLFYIS